MNRLSIDIKAISALAKLDLSEAEQTQFTQEMEQFAEFAKCLKDYSPDEINSDCILPLNAACFRNDTAADVNDSAGVLSNAKSVYNGYITVPVTVESEEQ